MIKEQCMILTNIPCFTERIPSHSWKHDIYFYNLSCIFSTVFVFIPLLAETDSIHFFLYWKLTWVLYILKLYLSWTTGYLIKHKLCSIALKHKNCDWDRNKIKITHLSSINKVRYGTTLHIVINLYLKFHMHIVTEVLLFNIA